MLFLQLNGGRVCFTMACYILWLGSTETMKTLGVSMPSVLGELGTAFELRMKGPPAVLEVSGKKALRQAKKRIRAKAQVQGRL